MHHANANANNSDTTAHRTQRHVTALRRPVGNAEVERRLRCLREAIDMLSELNLTVLEVDVNRAMPVILIQVSPRNKALGTAFAYSMTGGAHGRVRRVQTQRNGCRIEWDVQGH
ncbi:MAG: hypothetical protein FNT29_06055 [Halothiobacillaceae bacterium]|nr:MAG: hypothetical protein FNT29_06055 [Halothiobacillaceae bacterium]